MTKKRTKKISVNGYCLNEKLRYGRETMATVNPECDAETFVEFFNLIEVAPEMLIALKELMQGWPSNELIERTQRIIAQAERK